MLNLKLSRVGLSCALAVTFAVASTASAAPTPGASTRILNSKLPKGVNLANASCPQTYDALKAAAAEHPDMVVKLLRTAVAARSLKESKFPCDCLMLAKLVDAAAVAAPERVRELAENALALDPECSQTLDDYLAGVGVRGVGGIAGETGLVGDVGEGGLGAGFGPGFPGSPGFIGSAPGGTIALPPVGVAVTSVVNG